MNWNGELDIGVGVEARGHELKSEGEIGDSLAENSG
jgi:hypothetical protein